MLFSKNVFNLSDFIHPQRDLSDDDIILGLKMYESKMSRLQRRVTKQINVINKQKKKIADLQFHLKHKGGNHEVDDLRAKIASQADEAIKNLQFASLETLGRGTEHEAKGQTVSVRSLSVIVGTCWVFFLRNCAIITWRLGNGCITLVPRAFRCLRAR